MAHIVRIGDTIVNLEYLASVELARSGDHPSDVETVYMDRGRALYFEGENAEAVRKLVRTFPRFPAGETPAGSGECTEYSTGSDVLPHGIRKVGNGE